MAKIGSKNTKPELLLRRLLRKEGIYFAVYSKLPGTPDIVFRRKKVAVFVDGEFWHGHNWLKLGKKPPNEFWKKKLLRNMARDKRVNRDLQKMGWKVMRILEGNVLKKPEKTIRKIISMLNSR